jgi:hypothetical protein
MPSTPETYLRRTRTIAAQFGYEVSMGAAYIDMYMDTVWGHRGVGCDDPPESAYALVPFDKNQPLLPSNAFPLTKKEAECYMRGTLDMPPEIMSRIGEVMDRIRNDDTAPYVPVRPPPVVLSDLPEDEGLRLANECFAYLSGERRELGASGMCLVQLPDQLNPTTASFSIRK